MTRTREEVLIALVSMTEDLDTLSELLAGFAWDSEAELVVIRAQHLESALNAFLRGELASHDLERWANLIEARDDLTMESGFAETIRECLFALANPRLEGPLTRGQARLWRDKLAEQPKQGN